MKTSPAADRSVCRSSKTAAAYNAAAEKECNFIGTHIAEERTRQKLSLAAQPFKYFSCHDRLPFSFSGSRREQRTRRQDGDKHRAR